MILVTVRENEPFEKALRRFRRKVERATGNLPDGVIGPFVNDEFGDVFGTILAVRGEGFSYSELEDVADEVRDQLLRLPDVAKVEVHGAQEERVFVEYNNARLAELDLSASQLTGILASRNIIIPGGAIDLVVDEVAELVPAIQELRGGGA